MTTCSANATGRIASEWGESAVPCTVTRGLRSHIDAQGIVRHFCAVHEAQVVRRFGRLSEATRVALAIHRISADFTESLRYTETDEGEFVEPDDGWREGQPEFGGQFR